MPMTASNGILHDQLGGNDGTERPVVDLTRELLGFGLAVCGVYPAVKETARLSFLHDIYSVLLN